MLIEDDMAVNGTESAPVDNDVVNEEGSAPSEEEAVVNEEGSAPSERKSKYSGYNKRVRQLSEKAKTLEEENLFLKSQIEGRKTDYNTPAKAEGKPNSADYEDYESYLEALADWKTEVKLADIKKQAADAEKAKTRHTIVESFEEKADIFTETHEDFYEIAMAEDVPYTDDMQELVLSSDKGPELAYYLGRNKNLAYKISQMSPLAAAKELGRIEAGFATISKTKKSTKAPPPINPLRGNGETAQPDLSKMSQEEYVAYRNGKGR